MSDYIKREDAISAIAEGSLIFASSQLSIDAAMLSAFSKIKKADVVEVVRCKDCKYIKNDLLPKGTGYVGYCAYSNDFKLMHDDDFCSWGERRTDND